MSYATLENIRVSYDGKTQVLQDLNLSIERGELVSLLGSSGCGKTTTLRVVAGFIEPSAGRFMLDGRDLTRTAVHKRNFGLVFQSYALFPHLTVFENVAFGLRLRKLDSGEISKKVAAMLDITDLSALSRRYPKQLSGGQRQRVALARALVIEPELLLLDEPLSNLDAKLRLGMRVEIKRLQKRLGITTIFVTHDQEECFSISDRVAIMDRGVIQQFDSPENIYSRPANEFVARFVGFTNFFDLTKLGRGRWRDGNGEAIDVDPGREPEGDLVSRTGAIRPDDIALSGAEPGERNEVSGIVEVRTFLGRGYQYELSTKIGRLVVNAPRNPAFEQGERVSARFPSNKIVLC
ncbi:MAG: spermidine/putrescine ABC transporter ATP-binding protein [Treponema sp. GWB1_62_6]|nr:MAG: spermidine/putrescine ABC transporter ATP-binding protein [Treponema sp. GWC1_61_84]OHE63437.1 MAG: spermidine/putrescine ABC transporter ATP-binding protein [Treponema sp. GWB1_62_6]OHE76284.1 MAG: spermidine/putrescine ABC transporter ATP-binding protein [Treponema sp. RIFOXYC1_FULL_61_9]